MCEELNELQVQRSRCRSRCGVDWAGLARTHASPFTPATFGATNAFGTDTDADIRQAPRPASKTTTSIFGFHLN